MKAAPISVLCVDDHPIVREGIAVIINGQGDLTVYASAETGEEAVRLYGIHRPDVVLMDLQLPGISGLEAIKQIRAIDREAKIIVLTMYEGDEDIYQSLRAGAAAYLLKETVTDNVIQVIRQVHRGEYPISPPLQRRLADHETTAALTAREVQVLRLVADGFRNKEVADVLNITQETAHVHMRNILAKLQVHDRTAAVSAALRRGIIHLK
jgi:DNA-binding NarL/FixJ family response regulator